MIMEDYVEHSCSSISKKKSCLSPSSKLKSVEQVNKKRSFCGEIQQSLGLHGVRRIQPKKRSIFLSVVWCVILLCGLALFLYEMSQCILIYLSYPTGWALGYLPPSAWPGITICNLNPVRITQLAKNYWEAPASSRNANRNGRITFEWKQFLEDRTFISSREFFLYNSHNVDDMVVRCITGNIPCSSDSFSMTPTEDGLCQKIIPDKSIDTIELWLNSEAYEYIEGLSHSTGFKVYIHDNDQVPIRDDAHVYIFPGYNFDLIIGSESYESFAKSNGGCRLNAPVTRQCLSSCYMDAVRGSCDCVPFWYSMHGQSECNVYKHFTCVKDTIDREHKQCRCTRSCHHSYYTANLEMYPTTITLTDFFPQNPHNITTVLKRFEKSKDIHSLTSQTLKDKDNYVIDRFISTYEKGKLALEKSQRGLYEIKMSAKAEVKDLKSRIHLHTDIALGGVMKILKLGYTNLWEMIELTHLDKIAYDSRSIMSKYDRALKHLKFATATEMTMARVFYTMGDMELSIKTDLAAEALENVTKLYYAYINAEPNLSIEITPNKRYDDALVPYSILMNDIDSHKKYYSELSNKLGNYIETIITLKTIIRKSLTTRNFNETAKNITRDLFLSHSVAIEKAKIEFRENIVQKCEMKLKSKIVNMNKLNALYQEGIDYLKIQITSMESYLFSIHHNIYQDLEHVITACKDYIHHSNISKAGIVFTVTQYHIAEKLHQMEKSTVELLIQYRHLSELSTRLHITILKIWMEFFHEEILTNFYIKLNNDVMQMMSNDLKTQYMLNIFTDERMLNMPLDNRTGSGVLLEEFLVLLNADIPIMDYNTKSIQINQTFIKISDLIGEGYDFINNLKDVGSHLTKTYEYMKDYEESLHISDSFAKDNLLKVKITLNSAEFRQWTEHSTYSLTAFIAQIGGLAAFILGASALTILEICDILLSWCGNKFCTQGSQATKECPAEYRTRLKPPPNLNSTSSPRSSPRDMDMNSSLDSSQRRSYVTFKDFNHINGSEV